MMVTEVSTLETLASRNRVCTVAAFDSSGFSIPNAAVCRILPSRITATPTAASPRSTVAAAITASKPCLLNLAGVVGGVVVLVVGRFGVVGVVLVVSVAVRLDICRAAVFVVLVHSATVFHLVCSR